MKAIRLILALVVVVAAPGLAQRNELASLFPSQAAIEAPMSGRLVRLDLPAGVIAACRADLSDLRVFDAEGREVPFLVESGAGESSTLESVAIVPVEVLETSRETQERENAPALRREVFVLPAPPPAATGTGWELVLAIGAPDFVSRIEVREAGESTSASGGAPTAAVAATGSIFRLRDVGAEKLGLALPAAIAAPRLAVTLDTEGSSFLEPAFRYESRRRIEGGGELEVPLATGSSQAEGLTTVVVLERPAGLVPARLRLATTTPFFRRAIEVWDEGAGARRDALGRRLVFRVQGAAAVEELEVPLAAASGDALRVVIEDGDSPALDRVAFTAVLPGPSLLFALPGEGGPATATLRFGGGRALAPRYDVAALPPSLPAAGADAQVGEVLHDHAGLPAASLGAIAANPGYDAQPALAWAWRPGAALDPRLWSHRIRLEANPSPEGLSRLRLEVADLAVARADLADLRLVDAEHRQWAYLIEPAAGHQTRNFGVGGPVVRDRATVWTFNPPAAPATADRLALRTAVAYFDRPYELTAILGDEKRTIASGRLVRAGGDPRPPTIVFPATRFDRLELEIVDGDDAPIELEGAEGRFQLADVFFAVPEGRYSLLVGYPEAAAPSYELERARELVLAARAAPVVSDGVEGNDEFSASARVASGEGWQRALLWGAIVVLVGFLTVLTLRLARTGGTK